MTGSSIEYYAPKRSPLNSPVKKFEFVTDFISNLFEEEYCILAERIVGHVFGLSSLSSPFEREGVQLKKQILWLPFATNRHSIMSKVSKKMHQLVDTKTLIIGWESKSVNDMIAKVAATIEVSYQSVISLAEIAAGLEKQQIHTIIIFCTSFCAMTCEEIGRLFRILDFITKAKCTVHCVVDDIAILGRLPLVQQSLFDIIEVPGRPIEELLVEICQFLLDLQYIPEEELVSIIADNIYNQNMLIILLKLTLLEKEAIVWNFESFREIPQIVNQVGSSLLESPEGQVRIQQVGNTATKDAQRVCQTISCIVRIVSAMKKFFLRDIILPEESSLVKHAKFADLIDLWLDRIISATGLEDTEVLTRKVRLMMRFIEEQVDKEFGIPLLEKLQVVSVDKACLAVQSWVLQNLRLMENVMFVPQLVGLSVGAATEKLLTPKIGESIQMALRHPEFYLSGTIREEGIVEENLDACTLWTLASECGRLINTMDWFNSFKSIVDADGTADEKHLV